MIAVDTNILVYAHRADSPWHDRAAACIGRLAEQQAQWLIPWPCIHEFLAVVTHPRIYSPPTPMDAAVVQVDAWLASPSLVLGGESHVHWTTLRQSLLASKATGPTVHDARVAAICRDHDVESLWTADRDFSRFAGVRALNPLTA